MKLLLDTHVLLWALVNDRRLSQSLRDGLAECDLFVSAASVWEVGTKRALDMLDVPATVFDTAADAGCRALPITWDHAQAAASLPPHHADPFDRMLIAQARSEGLTLATADRAFVAYDVEILG